MLTREQATRLGQEIAELWNNRDYRHNEWMNAHEAFVPLAIDEMIERATTAPPLNVTTQTTGGRVHITATGDNLGFVVLMGSGQVLVYRREEGVASPTSSNNPAVVAVVEPRGRDLGAVLGGRINGTRTGDTLSLATAIAADWQVRMTETEAQASF